MDLTNEDVTDILALLDSLPYDELDVQTTRFRLILRRTPDGWTQSVESRSAPTVLSAPDVPSAPGPPVPGPEGSDGVRGTHAPSIGAGGTHAPLSDAGPGDSYGVRGTQAPSIGAGGTHAPVSDSGTGGGTGGGGGGPGRELVAVRAPLPGTFYRAPRPGAAPFVEVGSQVGADTVVGIVETMKLMNSVTAGVDGTVAEICLANAEFAANGATLLRIRAD
jgi:acetyl-CoA carboxylase biotin carboxyl carrier protein